MQVRIHLLLLLLPHSCVHVRGAHHAPTQRALAQPLQQSCMEMGCFCIENAPNDRITLCQGMRGPWRAADLRSAHLVQAGTPQEASRM